MGRNQTSMKRGKLQSVVKQMRQVQTAAQKRRRLDKEREAAARNKEARNHKIAAERAKLPFASYESNIMPAYMCCLCGFFLSPNGAARTDSRVAPILPLYFFAVPQLPAHSADWRSQL